MTGIGHPMAIEFWVFVALLQAELVAAGRLAPAQRRASVAVASRVERGVR